MMNYITSNEEQRRLFWTSSYHVKNMKPSISYLLFTERVLQDQVTKLNSYINVFGGITIPESVGVWYQPLTVAGVINDLKPGEVTMDVKLVRKEGEKKEDFFTINLTGVANQGGTGIIANFGVLKFEKAGKYFVEVFVKGKRVPSSDDYYINVINERN